MDRREAYEGRVWRLAWLLSGGREELCARVAAACLDARPDLEQLDPAHLNRLVVLAARRRVRAAPAVAPDAPDAIRLLAAVCSMNRQRTEAWIFSHIDGLGPMEMARAMDCSKTAALRHLERAEAELAQRFGPALPAMLESLRAAADRVAPSAAHAAFRAERRRRRRVKLALIAFAALALVLVAIFMLVTFRAVR